MSRIKVVGLGNPLMGDDGVGVVALSELDRLFEIPKEIELLDGGVLGLHLLGRVEEAETLLVLDAVSANLTPGSIVRLEWEQVRLALANKLSMHQVGFSDVLATASLRGRTPPYVVVLGVQPLRVEPGLGLSAPVRDSLVRVVELAARELTDWGAAVPRRESPPPSPRWESMLSA